MISRGINLLRRNFSSDYSRAMYKAWRKDPKDIYKDWNIVFSSSSTQDKDTSVSSAPNGKIEVPSFKCLYAH
jgi:hypothetical protein